MGRVIINTFLLFLENIKYFLSVFTITIRRCPRGVMINAVDCGIVVSEFELQSRYYVHFRTSKGMKPPYPPSYGLNSITTILLEEWLGIR